MSIPRPFSKRRQQGIAGDIARVIRLSFAAGEISSIFGLEGTMRTALRTDLCLRGWAWQDAQQAAIDIVAGAYSLLGAERPAWDEGQPEFVIAEGVLIERTRCKRCHKRLPDGHFKFCGNHCRVAHHLLLMRLRATNEDNAADLAIRSIY